MANAQRKAKQAFKDYYLILQVHPEADAAMIDNAYWHLARRLNEAGEGDRAAREELDVLNEAYNVLGSATRRDEYNRLRAEILGAGTLPSAPAPKAPTPPLTVMSRQKPREKRRVREAAPAPSGFQALLEGCQRAFAGLIKRQ